MSPSVHCWVSGVLRRGAVTGLRETRGGTEMYWPPAFPPQVLVRTHTGGIKGRAIRARNASWVQHLSPVQSCGAVPACSFRPLLNSSRPGKGSISHSGGAGTPLAQMGPFLTYNKQIYSLRGWISETKAGAGCSEYWCRI